MDRHGRDEETTAVGASTPCGSVLDPGVWRALEMMREPLTVGGVIRKLGPDDVDAYSGHLSRIDGEDADPTTGDLRAGDPPCGTLAARVERALRGGVTHGFFVEGVLRGAAELHLVPGSEPVEAEVTFSIETAFRNVGIGAALFGRTLLMASHRGVAVVVLRCDPAERPGRAPSRSFGSAIRYNLSDVDDSVSSAGPTPISRWREFIADGTGIAASVMDARTRTQRLG